MIGRRKQLGMASLVGTLAVAVACGSLLTSPDPATVDPAPPVGRERARTAAQELGETDEEAGGDRPELGKWRRARELPADALSDEQQRVIAELEAIGYADGTRAVQADQVIAVHDRDRAFQGYNLFNSGHASEAYLVDMDGRVLHRWGAAYADAFPNVAFRPGAPGTNHWRRVHLDEGGVLWAVHEGRGLVKLAFDSSIAWAVDNRAHHDLVPLGGGRVAVLARRGTVVPDLGTQHPVLIDFIEWYAADGTLERSVGILDALLASPWAGVVTDRKRIRGDLLHTNSLEFLDGRGAERNPAFAAGRALVSFRNSSSIAVVDVDEGRVAWLAEGDFLRQHDATMLDDGHLLVFDNGGRRRASAVREYDPADMTQTWIYGGTDDRPFWSGTLGTNQRLPNGNTLITESDGGRAFEVAPDGTIVWEMFNPFRAGDDGEFIAALFEVVRYTAEELAALGIDVATLEPRALDAVLSERAPAEGGAAPALTTP